MLIDDARVHDGGERAVVDDARAGAKRGAGARTDVPGRGGHELEELDDPAAAGLVVSILMVLDIGSPFPVESPLVPGEFGWLPFPSDTKKLRRALYNFPSGLLDVLEGPS